MRQEKISKNVSEYSPFQYTDLNIQEMKNGAGLGRDCAVLCAEPQMAAVDQDIVVSKWIGLEGTL